MPERLVGVFRQLVHGELDEPAVHAEFADVDEVGGAVAAADHDAARNLLEDRTEPEQHPAAEIVRDDDVADEEEDQDRGERARDQDLGVLAAEYRLVFVFTVNRDDVGGLRDIDDLDRIGFYRSRRDCPRIRRRFHGSFFDGGLNGGLSRLHLSGLIRGLHLRRLHLSRLHLSGLIRRFYLRRLIRRLIRRLHLSGLIRGLHLRRLISRFHLSGLIRRLHNGVLRRRHDCRAVILFVFIDNHVDGIHETVAEVVILFPAGSGVLCEDSAGDAPQKERQQCADAGDAQSAQTAFRQFG